jgi:hypothetical protein
VISTGKPVLIIALLTQNLNFSYLTCKKEMFSLDTWYGYATGFFCCNNELGNPVRDIVTGTLVTTVLIQVVLSYLVLF